MDRLQYWASTYGMTSGLPKTSNWRAACLAAVLLCAAPGLHAHTVAVEQVVRIVAGLTNGVLQLHLDVPLTAVSDAGLILASDGTLPPDVPVATLTPVATQVLRNLDVRNERALRLSAMSVVPSADRRALAIDASFPVASLAGVSASLNAFQSLQFKPVVTELDVRRQDGGTTHIRIEGMTTRSLLDPGVREVLSGFAARGASSVAAWQVGTLMLLCLLATPLSTSAASRRVGVLVAGQIAGALAGLLAPRALAAAAPFPVLIVAALVVLGGLHMLFGRRASIAVVLAGAVGALHGALTIPQLIGPLPLAGAHTGAAVVSFLGVALVVELWMAALVFSLREWVTRRGVPARVLEYAIGAFVVHSALHVMFEASPVAAESFVGAHAVVLVTVACALVVVAVARGGARGRAALAGEARA